MRHTSFGRMLLFSDTSLKVVSESETEVKCYLFCSKGLPLETTLLLVQTLIMWASDYFSFLLTKEALQEKCQILFQVLEAAA